MKKLIVCLLVLGFTMVLNVEEQKGFVIKTDDQWSEVCIVMPSIGQVIWMSGHQIQSMEKFHKRMDELKLKHSPKTYEIIPYNR